MITIYTVAFNEEVILPYMIEHYRSRFPNCQIVIRDNQSTDRTVQIAQNYQCQLISYQTNQQIDDVILQQTKNTCWKSAPTDWVLVCDPDEFLEINEDQLKAEESLGTTIIKPEGYDLTNLEDNYNVTEMKYGARDTQYDKSVLFNKKYIQEINYNCGAHQSQPIGKIQYNCNKYNLYHYKFINPDYVVARYKLSATRLSSDNKKHGMGIYVLDSEEKIRAIFQERREKAVKCR